MGEYVKTSWNILDIFFKDNPSFLVNHHLQSYNDFFDNGITQLLKEKNPIHFFKKQEKMTIDHETKYIDELDKSGFTKAITFEEMKEIYPFGTDRRIPSLSQTLEEQRGPGPRTSLKDLRLCHPVTGVFAHYSFFLHHQNEQRTYDSDFINTLLLR